MWFVVHLSDVRLDYDENLGSFTCSVGGEWWREMMLKEKVVLVRNTSYAPEDRASHEIINVRSKPINNLGSCQWSGTRNTQRAEIHTSWSSHKFNWAICPLALANGSVEYLVG
jgi:hypothetical protein